MMDQNEDGLFRKTITRRDFIQSSTLALAAFSLPGIAGCTKKYPQTDCLPEALKTLVPVTDDLVFQKASLGRIKVRNRIIRSATTLGSVDSYGRPTEKLLDQYAEMAKGGVGTIITGMGDTGLLLDEDVYRESDAGEYGKVPRVIHKHNAAVLQQISHQGSQIAFSGGSPDGFSLNRLSDSGIEGLIAGFVKAVIRSRETGFDGVQLHGAHGYLLSEFLSPAMNKRTDKWGGTTENRFRIIEEIYRRAKKTVGDFPILIKINAYDFQEEGMQTEEAVKIAVLLEKAGCDGIEVSSGVGKDGFSTIRVPEVPTEAILEFTPYGENISSFRKKISPVLFRFFVKRYDPLYNYNVCAAKTIKQHVNIPVIAVGGIHDMASIRGIIGEKAADFAAMSRPFIIEPDIVNRFQTEEQTASGCISCGFCIVSLAKQQAECFYGSV
jgi:2,4-dienoyl-CoA reductase-like NADH-dependent reductase (Old Yellow Enzyme family)